MKMPKILLALFKGHKLERSVTVKNVTMLINIVSALAIGASHAGILAMTPAEINSSAGHVIGLISTFFPYLLAVANVYSHAATSETVGLTK